MLCGLFVASLIASILQGGDGIIGHRGSGAHPRAHVAQGARRSHLPIHTPFFNDSESIASSAQHCAAEHASLKLDLPSTSFLNELQVLAGKGKHRSRGNSRACAVVSSSSVLLEYEYGPLIDSHDVIIRFNFAPTINFARHVGRRTHIRQMGRNWVFWEGAEVNLHRYNQLQYLERDRQVMAILENNKTNRVYPETKAFTSSLNPAIQFYGLAEVPSSGFVGVALALEICDSTNVFGFQKVEGATAYHYYNDTEVHATVIRDFINKYNLTRKWQFEEEDLAVSSSQQENPNKPAPHHAMQNEWAMYKDLESKGKLNIYPPLHETRGVETFDQDIIFLGS